MNKYLVFLYGLVIGGVITISLVINDKRSKAFDEGNLEIKVEPPNYNGLKRVKGYDFENNTWKNYSDEEIRMLREKQSFKSDGSYIYTPGRHIPSRQEEIEEYIDDHIDEIIDEYRD